MCRAAGVLPLRVERPVPDPIRVIKQVAAGVGVAEDVHLGHQVEHGRSSEYVLAGSLGVGEVLTHVKRFRAQLVPEVPPGNELSEDIYECPRAG